MAASYLKPKPRNFAATSPDELSREAMVKAVTDGRQDTAMKSFSRTLSKNNIELVVDFVRQDL